MARGDKKSKSEDEPAPETKPVPKKTPVQRPRRRLYEAEPPVDETPAAPEPAPEPEPEPEPEPDEVSVDEREADRIVSRHVLKSVGIGLVPFPLFSTFGLSAIQLGMLSRLASLHGVPYRRRAGRSALTALVGGSLTELIGVHLALELVRFVPLVGLATMPVLAGASTYAVGKVFGEHFVNGGTLQDFDGRRARARYESAYRDGIEVAGRTSASR